MEDSCGHTPGQYYFTADQAAIAFAEYIGQMAIRMGWEYGAFIFYEAYEVKDPKAPGGYRIVTKGYYYTEPFTDKEKDRLDPESRGMSSFQFLEAFAHIHPLIKGYDYEIFRYMVIFQHQIILK
jgi:hypothetical protein